MANQACKRGYRTFRLLGWAESVLLGDDVVKSAGVLGTQVRRWHCHGAARIAGHGCRHAVLVVLSLNQSVRGDEGNYSAKGGINVNRVVL